MGKNKNRKKKKTQEQSEGARQVTKDTGTSTKEEDTGSDKAAMASNLGEYWQVDKSLIQCLQYLLDNNNQFNDVIFKLTSKDIAGVCEEEVYVPALQTLLLARSPVFSAMFSGSMSNKKDDQLIIDLPDVEPDAFKQLIGYVYTDQVHLTADNVTSIMYLSKKYMVNNLTKECVQFLERELRAETAPILLDQSMFFDEKELKEKVLATIEEEAPAVLLSDEFSKMSHQALNEVLQLNLKIENELQVFQACMKWAEQKCVELKQSVEGEKKREVLAENLFLIRFPTMRINDICEHVVPHDVLNADEERKIFRYIGSASNKPQDLPFPTEHRTREHTVQASMGATIDALHIQHAATCINQQPITIPQGLRTSSTGSCSNKNIHFTRNETKTFTTNLKCNVSRQIQITKILFAAFPDSQLQQSVVFTLTQNGRRLTSYSGAPHQITRSPPSYCTVNLNDAVRVEAGPMELEIHLSATNTHRYYRMDANVCFSSSASQLSDEYVTIDFTPVRDNVLHGIEYSLVA